MPLVFQAVTDEVTVDFGDSQSITFKMNADAMTVASARKLAQESQHAEFIRTRIARLKEQIEREALEEKEFENLFEQLKRLQDTDKFPDELSLMSTYVTTCSSGWTDYFATQADLEAGRVIPFNKENIERINPQRLGRIIEAFNKYFGFVDAESKKSSGSLPSSSETPTQA